MSRRKIKSCATVFAFLLGIVGAVMAALCAFGLGAMLTGTL